MHSNATVIGVSGSYWSARREHDHELLLSQRRGNGELISDVTAPRFPA